MDTPIHPTQSFMSPGSQEGIRQDTADVNKAFLGIRQAGWEPHWEARSAHQARSGLQGSAGSSEQSAMGQGSGWAAHSRSNHGREGQPAWLQCRRDNVGWGRKLAQISWGTESLK